MIGYHAATARTSVLVNAVIKARRPPAESPQTPMRSASKPYLSACARRNSIAAAASSFWAGQTASLLRR